jgi:IclR family pca regulon transcriptional regulator
LNSGDGTSVPANARPRGEGGRPAVLEGFAKGLAIIEVFALRGNRLTIAEASRLSRLNRATARRCLLTLVERGYATVAKGVFELTPGIMRLGRAFVGSSMTEIVSRTLPALAATVRESCSAGYLDGADVVYVGHATRHGFVTESPFAGIRIPAFCSSLGRALLAELPEDRARGLLLASPRKRLTPHTLTDVEAIMARLATVRAEGCAWVDRELYADGRSIGMAVRNVWGEAVVAISIGFPVSRDDPERVRGVFIPALRECTAELAGVIG